jgi:hypothetical protein
MQGCGRDLGILTTGASWIDSVEAFCELLAHFAHFHSVVAQPLNLVRGFLG